MIIDIAKFLFLFFLILTSFACGLNQLYWYSDSDTSCDVDSRSPNCSNSDEPFMTIDASYTALLWSLFGVIPIKELSGRRDQAFTKWVGHALLGAYMIMAMTVMINMLIAMMSRSFQDIEDHADREWKFARSKLWMSYFDEGSTLPPPFNLIISPKSIYYFLRGIKNLLVKCLRQCRRICCMRTFDGAVVKPEDKTVSYIGDTSEEKTQRNNNGLGPHVDITNFSSKVNYQEVMKRLVSRYIHQAKKQLRQDGVNEDDLLEIKQDISSLRYELREDRKREVVRNTGQINSIKRDIIRSLSGSQMLAPVCSTPPSSPQHSDPHVTFQTMGDVLDSGQKEASRILVPNLSMSKADVDVVRKEISEGVKSELRDLLREIQMQSCLHGGCVRCERIWGVHPSTGHPSLRMQHSMPMPSMPSDLYQTHLFTQL